MNISFIDKLFSEYPVPRSLSCWGSLPGVKPIEDIEVLIHTCVDELASDILIDGSVQASGMITQMPKGTITCTSAMLAGIYPFQGNRLVKVTYDASSNIAYLRWYPAVINYRRRLTRNDLETLVGDRLIYFKAYAYWKMTERELSILKTPNMTIDNGQIDLSVLEAFREKQHNLYLTMKDQIVIYSTVN